MKKYFLILAIAMIATMTTVNAQCSKSCTGTKKECCKSDKKGAAKSDGASSSVSTGTKADTKAASCEKKCSSTCTDKKGKGTASAKCDTTMCKKNSASCKGMKK